MVKINSEGEYLLKSGAGSIFRKYTQNSRVPPTATVVGDTPPPPFGYKFPNTIPKGTLAGNPSVLTGKLVTAVDMWVNPTTQDDAIKKYGDIQYWDVSNVTDMEGLFAGSRSGGLRTFNGNIRNWDVSKVTNMARMFHDATAFNQPLGGWDVSKVTNMFLMFSDAKKFNQVLDKWDVGKVTFMNDMFSGATAFDQRLGSWDVSKVTFMKDMFNGATAFMANDDNYTHATNGISKWKPANITVPIANMFFGIATNTGVGPKWGALHGTGATGATPLIDSTTGTVTSTGAAAPPPGTASTGIFYK